MWRQPCATFSARRVPHSALRVAHAKPDSVAHGHAWLTLRAGIRPLTGVCKNEIIATNRPHHLWIPAYAGMTEWA